MIFLVSIKNIFRGLCGLPKTIYFNFRCLPIKDAIKLPILISPHVCLMDTSGTVKITTPIRFGMVKIGFGEVGIFDPKYSRSIWQVSGNVTFHGTANLGHGSKISVGKTATLYFGDNFVISAESAIVCQKKISFGDDVLLSWDILIMDTDFHRIEKNGLETNLPKEISIGNHVWIACRCTILKGSSIPDGSIIAARSLVTKNFSTSKSIIGGSPAKIICEDINWNA